MKKILTILSCLFLFLSCKGSPQKEVDLESKRAAFLKSLKIQQNELDGLVWVDGLQYASGRFGETKYLFKMIVNESFVINLKSDISDDLSISSSVIVFREIKSLSFKPDGRILEASYGSQGSLTLKQLRSLIKSKGESEDPKFQPSLRAKVNLKKEWLSGL